MQMSDHELFISHYIVSDRSGYYYQQQYQTFAEAQEHCDWDAGEAVGTVLSDGSVTFCP